MTKSMSPVMWLLYVVFGLAAAVTVQVLPFGAFVFGAAPAAAAVPALQTVNSLSPFDSVSPKITVVTCPVGTRILNASASTLAGFGEVIIERQAIDAINQRAIVQASEHGGGFTGNWAIQAFAICAAPVPGLQVVTATSQATSDTNRVARAVCPAGKKVLGGGAEVVGGFGQVVLEGVLPDSGNLSEDPLTVLAVAAEDDTGFFGAWSLRVYAVCANPLPGHQELVFLGGASFEGQKSIVARCPIGKRIVGTGFAITNGQGSVLTALTGVPELSLVQTVTVAKVDGIGANPFWALQSRLVCVNQP